MENFQNENGPRLEKGWEPLFLCEFLWVFGNMWSLWDGSGSSIES